MKTCNLVRSVTLALLLFTLSHQFSNCLAQGSLTPPGPPAATMKTLQQIEPRTPITSLPVTITEPGSYYLTGSFDLSSGDGIFISAHNVTIDLNGFTIRSFDPGTSSVGIRIDTTEFAEFHDITIFNGHIVGSVFTNSGAFVGDGFGYGIYSSGAPKNVRVVGVTVSGCRYDGINVGMNSTVVQSCAVTTVGGSGIIAAGVSGCTASDCGGSSAINAETVSDSYGSNIGVGDGVDADTAIGCEGISSSANGMVVQAAQNCRGVSKGSFSGVAGSSINGCFGYSSGSGNGVISGGSVINCYGECDGTGTGIFATCADNCYGLCVGGYGVIASTANQCFGSSSGGTGLQATTAINSIGYTGMGNPVSYGLYASSIAIGCYGSSAMNGTGLRAHIANSCAGTTVTYDFHYNMPP